MSANNLYVFSMYSQKRKKKEKSKSVLLNKQLILSLTHIFILKVLITTAVQQRIFLVFFRGNKTCHFCELSAGQTIHKNAKSYFL